MEIRTLILGAGAAGLMCAGTAGPGCLVIDHAKAPGKKIRISGGGRCNFTNTETTAERFLSNNPHFAKSALARYTQWDFLDLVESHGIAWHEKTRGQLFCNGSASEIVTMLLDRAQRAQAQLWLQTTLEELTFDGRHFQAELIREGHRVRICARHLVLATGGKSIPKMGATGLAYRIAQQFGLNVTKTRPGLVPFTLSGPLEPLKALAGTALDARVESGGVQFDEAILFTHRGLSGPAALQVSSYWQPGRMVALNLDPLAQLPALLAHARKNEGRKTMKSILGAIFPTRLLDLQETQWQLKQRVADLTQNQIEKLCAQITDWRIKPTETEGYRTAEVTCGGIDTDGLSSKTMAAKHLPQLYCIGEALDVTGWLGGYNFQWAWSSAVAAGRDIAHQTERK